MQDFFSFSAKQIALAVLVSGLTAGGLTALISPGAADLAKVESISSKSNKSDRELEKNLPSSAGNASSRRIPLGCDPAFSLVAEPARAFIFKRCMV